MNLARRILFPLLCFVLAPMPVPAEELIESRPFASEAGYISLSPTLFTRLGPEATRINYTHKIALWHPKKRLYHSSFACGATALGDVDGDGLTDVFITGGPEDNRLYLQAEKLVFVDVTAGLRIEGAGLWAGGAVMVDIDNDRDLDIYVCYYDEPNQLFVNQLAETGKLSFVEQAAKFGLAIRDASLVPAFADYDLDGDLDVYLLTHQLHRPGGRPSQPIQLKQDKRTGKLSVAGDLARYYILEDEPDEKKRWLYKEQGRPDYLLRNDGGTFKNVTASAGITTKTNFGNSATWWDFNDDGRPDLHVGNDFLDPDYLYRNNGNGTFTEVSGDVLPQTTWFTMGTTLIDANVDGRNDFLAADMFPTTHYKQKASMASMGALTDQLLESPGARQIMRNGLFISTDTPRYVEAAYLAGLGQTDWTWSVKGGDYDQDGRQDLFFNNGAARNFNHSDLPALDHEALIGRNHWDIYEKAAPEKREQNLAFRNTGNLQFEDVSRAWGLDLVGMSYTCSQGDLDNDGDLDLIVASLNDPVFIYRNDGATGNAVRVRLRGTRSNSHGIGAKVYVTTRSGRQVRELQSAWGFMDADEASAHFGLGQDKKIDSLEVRWPSGVVQTFNNLEPNQLYTVTEPENAPGNSTPDAPVARSPLFAADDSLKEYPHRDEPFDDFARQPLLPHKLSQFGPSQAWGDVDGDGKLDLYLGGGNGSPGRLIYNKTRDGGPPAYSAWIQKIFKTYEGREDAGAVFFDADADGDLDLYVASGSVEHDAESSFLKDRLYLNLNDGKFSDGSSRLPNLRDSSSSVSAADFDRDGDVDLFVGTRSLIGEYPVPADSHLLINEKGRFEDRTEDLAPGLIGTGLVTSSLWADVDDDGWLDLVVAHDWGAIKVFPNLQGTLGPAARNGIESISGWWNSVAAADLDRDGDMDLVAGNLGLNTQYQATLQTPELIFYGDFEGTGKPHIVEANFENGVCYPRRGFSCSSQAMPFLIPKLKTYHNFASASISQIYGINTLRESTMVKVNEMRSGAFYNDGKGNFHFVPFPRIAHLAPVYGVALRDFNLDGYVDCYLAHNFFNPQVETGPFRAGLGQLLLANPTAVSDPDRFKPVPWAESGIVEPGDAKSVAPVDINRDGLIDLVVGLNDSAPSVFLNRSAAAGGNAFRVQLAGLDGNPTGIGARIRIETGGLPAQVAEVRAGEGFQAAVTGDTIFARPDPKSPVTITVRWPDGASSTATTSDGSVRIRMVYPEPDTETETETAAN